MFDQPTAPPEAKQSGAFAENPIAFSLDFRSGKSQPPTTNGKLTPQDLGVKFSYYRRSPHEGEKGETVEVNSFTIFVLGVYSRFAGVNFNTAKPSESEHYTSTPYRTVKDMCFFRKEYVRKIRENEAYKNEWSVGSYHQLRSFADGQAYREKVGYKKILFAYCLETDNVIEIAVSRRVEYGLAAAIAAATNTAHNPNRIGGLNDLSTEFWGFQFSGKYHDVLDIKGKECKPFDGKGEWGFSPYFACFVVSSHSQNKGAEVYLRCTELQMNVDAYVDSQIQWAEQIAGGKNNEDVPGEAAEQAAREAALATPSNKSGFAEPVAAPAMARNYEPFPTQEPPVGALEGDDLPF